MDQAITKVEAQFDRPMIAAVLPLAVLPAVILSLSAYLPAWKEMWLLAVSIYSGLKWLTFASSPLALESSLGRSLSYLFLWPGMDADAFFDPQARPRRPAWTEWFWSVTNISVGVLLLVDVVPSLAGVSALAAGWAGMVGLCLLLHFGVIHIVSLCWRLAGVNAEPIMNFPILARSLSDFWGRRWNMAFRDVAYGYILRPFIGKIGVAGATMMVFFVSGLMHDLVISVPVQGGWGGPTLYFLLQGAGLLIERSAFGRRMGVGRGLTGRVYCGLVTVSPVFLLFHEPFVRHAVVPTLAALGVY